MFLNCDHKVIEHEKTQNGGRFFFKGPSSPTEIKAKLEVTLDEYVTSFKTQNMGRGLQMYEYSIY